MKKFAALLIIISTVMAGCIVAEPPRGQYQYRGDRDGIPNRIDRDGDGVRNSQDRRPDDPRRY